jgi:hypothetical protein
VVKICINIGEYQFTAVKEKGEREEEMIEKEKRRRKCKL